MFVRVVALSTVTCLSAVAWTQAPVKVEAFHRLPSGKRYKIIESGPMVAGKRHGTWNFTLARGGDLMARGVYQKGLKVGVWTWNTPKGKTWFVQNWANNAQHGPATVFYPETGKIREKSNYQYGVLHGPKQLFHPNGVQHTQAFFRMGKPDGTQTVWSEKGVKTASTQYNDGMRNGSAARWDPDGKPRSLKSYKNDVLHGLQRTWKPGGVLSEEENRKDGELHGVRREYFDNGVVQREHRYKKGALNGGYIVWYSNGVKKEHGKVWQSSKRFAWVNQGKKETWHKNGKLASSMHYASTGLLDGRFQTWNEAGQLLAEGSYKVHKEKSGKHGRWTRWNDDGVIKSVENFHKGKYKGLQSFHHSNGKPHRVEGWKYTGDNRSSVKHGVSITYFDNGQKKLHGAYAVDRKMGTWTKWRSDGSVMATTNYVNGMRHGIETLFKRDGTVKRAVEYANGMPIREAKP